MVKLVVIASIAVLAVGSGAWAESKAAPPAQQKPQAEPDKPLPSPEEVTRWMADTVSHILDPVETIISPTSQ